MTTSRVPTRRRAVVTLLTADLLSTTGSEMTAVALPWFVLVSTGSPVRMGAVLAAEFAGIALLGIPGGRLAGALGMRSTMIASDLARSILIALIPVLYWAGELGLPVLLTVGFLIGGFFTAHQASQQSVLAAVSGGDELALTRVGGVLGAANETASFVGPALGGILVTVIGAASVLLLDAVSFLVSAALVFAATAGLRTSRVSRARLARTGETHMRLFDGLRWLRTDKRLRRRIAGLAVAQIAFTALIATIPVAARSRYHAGASLAGWLLASYGAGSAVGGLLSATARRTGGRIADLGMVGLAVSLWPLVTPLPSAGVAACIAANGVCSGLVYPRLFAALTLQPPERLRSLVVASATTMLSVTGPIGFLAAGLLLGRAGSVTLAFLLVAGSATIGSVIALSARAAPDS